MPVAKNIKYCRTKSGISQKEFAKLFGVAQSTVHSWETKQTSVTVPQAKRIANHFNIDFEEFCDVDLEKRDSDLMGGSPLTIAEIQNVLKFRTLSDETKTAIRAAIDAIYDAHQGE